MRVVLVCPYSWTTPGGVGHHVANLAERLRGRGHEVRIVTPAEGEVPAGVISVGRGVPVPYNGSVARLAFGPRISARVRVALRRAKPDIVHVHEPFAPSTSMLAAIGSKAPVVATFHAAAPSSRALRAASPILRPIWRKLAVRVVVSEEARRTVERVFDGQVRVIPNGIDLERFSNVAPLDPARRSVLFFGRLEKRKGAEVAVEAFVRLRRSHQGVRLVMLGDGAARTACESLVPPELKADVDFRGRYTNAELASALGECSVVALPSLGGESFGVVLLEALAAGRPVVASSIPGYAAVARDGVEALLVPPGDAGALAAALVRLLDEPDHAGTLAAAGLARAGEFDWRRVVVDVERAYTDALAIAAARA